VYRVLTGTGVRYDNNWAAITLGPDGTAYVGVLNGLIRVSDSAPAPEPAREKAPESIVALRREKHTSYAESSSGPAL
jgi:hypothetical protein